MTDENPLTAAGVPAHNSSAAEALKRAETHKIADGFYWFEGTIDGKEYIAPCEISEEKLRVIGQAVSFFQSEATGSFYPFESYPEVIAIW